MVDVDKKNDGVEEFNKYISMYGEPLTVKQATPNEGYHYIFNSISSEYTEEENYLITLLKNKSKYRKGKGIDIRINNGYITSEPSTINGKEYKYIRHYNDNKILNAPLTLLNWLLEFEKPNINKNLKLMMNYDQLTILIIKLSKSKYYNDDWFKITSCFKNVINEYNEFNEDEIKELWDQWSKQGNNYNKKNNNKIWDSVKIDINFNYYVNIFNKKLLSKDKKAKLFEYYETIKNYDALTSLNENIKKIEMNNKYIYDINYNLEQVKPEYFKNYNSIIIESGTGTGKTSNTAKHVKNIIDDDNENKYKILSIISRKTLAEQHIESFYKEGITLKNYQSNNINYDDDNVVICINSILKYQFYKPELFKNYIVYIDEVNTFIRHITHNETLDSILKKIYMVLNRIINNCFKLICTEAIISDNVFNLLNLRPDSEKVFIKNTIKKYDGIKAIKENDENNFFINIEKHIEENKYFLFGSDSCGIITKYYNIFVEKFNEKKDNFILITSNDKFIINNASEQFKNKFVFYSPSITCGIDFSIEDKQDVFLYMELNSIEPCDSFQQATRTRNINKLYYYVNNTNNNKEPTFNNINECSIFYKDVDNMHENLNNICCSIDENGDIYFNENSFFKMYVYNEYLIDIYKTNKAQHFKNILLNNGFKIRERGDVLKLEKETKKEMNDINKEVLESKFEEYIKGDTENEIFLFRQEYLKIVTEEHIEKFKEYIKDKYKFTDYRNLIRLFYSDEKLSRILKEQNKNNVYYKNLYTTANKIKLIRELEREAKIGILDINFKLTEDKININPLLIKNIQKAFRTKDEPTNYNELLPFYINRIENIIGNIKLFEKKRIQEDKKRVIKYSYDTSTIKYFFELHSIKYADQYGIHQDILEKFKEYIAINTPEDNNFIDDDDIDDKIIETRAIKDNIDDDNLYLDDGNTYFLNGVEVTRKEYILYYKNKGAYNWNKL